MSRGRSARTFHFVPSVLAVAAAAAGVTPAQARLAVPAGVHVVVTRLAGAPATRLLAVDAATGAVTPLPRFASDLLPPLAVAIDPYDHHLFVALDAGGGTSAVVRLVPGGAAFAERTLALGPGRVVQLAVAGDDLLVGVDAPAGGLFAVPRRGGALRLVRAQPNLTAMQIVNHGASYMAIAWTGRPGTAAVDSGIDMFLLDSGASRVPRTTFPNPSGRETTGIFETLFGPYLIAFDDGTFAQLTMLQNGGGGGGFVALPAVPPPPAGAATAMKVLGFDLEGIVVGNAAHPFVAEIGSLDGTFTLRSPALPGDPVDLAEMRAPGAQVMEFGERCGPVSLEATAFAFAEPGGAAGAELRGGTPGAIAVLVLGLDDDLFGALPAQLPGGCLLHVTPDAIAWRLVDAGGRARQSVPVPPGTALLDARLFAQWVHFGASLTATRALAFVVGT